VTSPVDQDVVLKAEGISKIYSGTVALRHADFDVRRGAVNVLVGENGAGKSTLMKIIAGVEQPTTGRILIDGVPVELKNSADALRQGIGIVFQELNLFGNLSVAENIFAAREITHGVLGIDHREQERRAAGVLARLQASIEPQTLVETLRVGQQQLVEIAKAVMQDARILIMD
jgi:erythritol transport system ATP-binding protein